MKIYIVRHGQTDYNINGIYAGRIDIPLNNNGIKEAYQVKEKLKGINFSKIYSSPLRRAYETAKIISDKDIIVDNRIIERSNGQLEGKPKTKVIKDIDFNTVNQDIQEILKKAKIVG